MARFGFGSAALALGLLLIAAAGQAVTIDDFGDGALQVVPSGNALSFQYTMSSGVILGGDREETVINIVGGSIDAGEVTPGSWTYGASNALGVALLVWDGAGGSFPGIDLGLGADLTELGAHDALGLSILSNDFAVDLIFRVYTSALDFSELTVNVAPGASTLINAFADFVDTGSGADFSNVGAITLEIDGLSDPDHDLNFDLLETLTTTPVPEPETAVMLTLGLALLAISGRRRNA